MPDLPALPRAWGDPHGAMMALGARCDLCPLRKCGAGPVPTEHPLGAVVAVVAQEPGQREIEDHRPMCGDTGQKLDRSLITAGQQRRHVLTTNVVACMPPGGDIRAFETKLQRLNKLAERKGEPTTALPTDCCAPRLHKELQGFLSVIPLGAVAAPALIPGWPGGILERRGRLWEVPYSARPDPADPRVVPGRKFLPTLNPAFVLRYGEWDEVLVEDLRRAWRWFAGTMNWAEPSCVYQPSVARVRELLDYRTTWPLLGAHAHAYDTETDSIYPTRAKLRCIGWGTPTWAANVPWLSRDGHTRFYSEDEYGELTDLFRTWATDARILKVGQNAGVYDRLVMEATFHVRPRPLLDTVLLHHLVRPELPHDLGFLGSHYTDINDWKGDFRGSAEKTDESEWYYNARGDVVVTARIVEPLAKEVIARGQYDVLKLDEDSQDACAELHTIGMGLDQVERARLDVEVLAKAKLWIGRVRAVVHEAGLDVAGIVKRTKKLDEENEAKRAWAKQQARETGQAPPEDKHDEWDMPSLAAMGLDTLAFNPISHNQVRYVLFDLWALPLPTDLKEEELYTSSGEVSTGDAILRRLLSRKDLTTVQRRFLFALRMARRWSKLWGTYINPTCPYEVALERNREPIVWEDGRLHATWNCLQVTGRYASQGPNCFDGETEVLTHEGWVRFDALAQGVPVAEWHEETGIIDFAFPAQYIERDYNGPMAALRHEACDLLVTPDHRVLLAHRKGGRTKVVPASDIPKPVRSPSDWGTLHAGHFGGGTGLALTDDQMRFLVAVQADGSWSHRVMEFRFDKLRKVKRMQALLVRLGASYTYTLRESPERTRHVFRCQNLGSLAEPLRLLGARKCFGPWLLQATHAQLEVFAEELWHWDGCFTTKSQYSSSIRENADWAQIALVLTGQRANLRRYDAASGNPNWQVDRKASSFNTITHRAEKNGTVPFSGRVYCLSVPSTFLLVRRNGRVTITGQCQNWPPIAKGMVVAQDGHVLIGADKDQLELRIAAARWRAAKYLQAFRDNIDPHQITMAACFGGVSAIMRLQGAPSAFGKKDFLPKSQFDGMRKLAKQIQYASQYGASTETVFRLVTAAEDKKTGELLQGHLKLDEVAAFHEAWLQGVPEFPEGWEREMERVRRSGFLLEPVTGRRRDFKGRVENQSEIVNFPIQGSAAGIMNLALRDLLKEIPFGRWGPHTGLINQCHDSLTLEVPRDKVEEAVAILDRIMNAPVPAYPDVAFSSEVKVAWPEDDERLPPRTSDKPGVVTMPDEDERKAKGLSRWSAT